MDEIYANAEHVKSVESRRSVDQTGVRDSHRRRHGAAVVCLGLLSVFLVAGLIGLGLHYHNVVRGAAAETSAVKANLSELLQTSNDKLSSVTEERDQLKANLTVMEQRDRMLRLSRQNKVCPAGWKKFGCSCYHVSSQSGSWTKGREECRKSGADLVVVDSAEEQTFLTKLTKQESWIGLSDSDKEGTWKWVDGSPLTVTFWNSNQPDNGNGDPRHGEEDCVHINMYRVEEQKWNDRSCEVLIPWICEKDL
ncbi:CD209 antigen-like protein C isoform X1 [Betta splendens]|uniref:CD209 antigen-like protein C isoform X1 n=1 Tax=Betta splendens TaxID=158456 RepID=A0A6P7LDW4_BETSP|nr:CD209 antigen-like protein C isoform X1 [Betta splendens]